VSLAQRTEPFTVADGLLTDVGGTLPARVLSTPGMIAMMERTAARLAAEHLAGCRKLRFEVEVREGDRVLGLGTHERRAIMGGRD
jgi:predicted thioesterase